MLCDRLHPDQLKAFPNMEVIKMVQIRRALPAEKDDAARHEQEDCTGPIHTDDQGLVEADSNQTE